MSNLIFSKTKSALVTLIIFLFPFFFLPITQEFYSTNKMYLLAIGALLLLSTSILEFLTSKKLVWQSKPLDMPVMLFAITVGLSILLASPNKVQAIFNPAFGLITIVSLTIIYFYFSREKNNFLSSIFYYLSSLLLSITTIFFFFQPFKNVNLPAYFQYLKNPAFSPLGSQLDLAIFLGLFVILGLITIVKKSTSQKTSLLNYFSTTISSLAFLLVLYSLIKSFVPNNPFGNAQGEQSLITNNLLLPPLNISWYAAIEILKNPMTALFGVGVDNFSSIFTKIKDIGYNMSPLWQINAFTASRSGLLHVLTEAGLFAFVALSLIIISVLKLFNQAKQHVSKDSQTLFNYAVVGYSLIMFVLFPLSLVTLFLFFLGISLISINSDTNKHELDVASILPLYLAVVIISIIVVASSAYSLFNFGYLPEYYYKLSLNGITNNNLKQLYDNQRQAILINPYIEKFRLNFAQTNLLIANNIASKANPTEAPAKEDQKAPQLSEQDRQTISSAIQAAIAEAKAAVTLNPQKAGNWENLAAVYRNIINVAQGADVWTISAYQRAIVLDPQNPIYRLNLGGIFYSFKNYEEASKYFEQAVSLKNDWPNAYYNLAWSAFQKDNIELAVNAMQSAISLLNPTKDKVDYDQAQKDLEEFKKKLPKTEEQTTQETGSTQPNKLTLPTPAPSISPKIELPKDASPEAK